MNWSRQGFLSRLAFIVVLCGSVVGLGASGILAYLHVKYRGSAIAKAKEDLTLLTVKATRDIGEVVSAAMAVADSAAAELTADPGAHERVAGQLQRALRSDARLYGSAITYVPHAHSASERLFSEYWYRQVDTAGGQGGEQGESPVLKYLRLDHSYDYTRPEYEWFGAAIQQGSRWSEPYFDAGAGNTLMTTYSAVFQGPDAAGVMKPRGVVTVDISMDGIRSMLERLELGPSGYGGLISRQGVYLYHPNSDWVLNRKTLLDVAREKDDADRLEIWETMRRGEGGLLDHVSTTTGARSWIIFHSVPHSGWSLQNTFLLDDVEMDVVLLRRQQMALVLAGVLTLICLAWLLTGAYRGASPRLWLASGLTTILLVAGSGLLWYISLSAPANRGEHGVPIVDRATLPRMMTSYREQCDMTHAEPPLFIPTGLFIDSIKFTRPNEVQLTGYVWQIYRDSEHAGLSRDFTLPEADSVEIEPVLRQREGDREIIRWHFQAEIPQHMTYSHYPLDREYLRVKIAHRDLDHNAVLVPDLAAYRITAPTARPGLLDDAFLPGWTISETFFSLSPKNVRTDFGSRRSVMKAASPYLSYNIRVQRNFLNAFISNLTALSIVSVLLFCVLFITGKVETGRLLSICVGMFFVIVIGHVNLRNLIAAQALFYLEYFHFTFYLALLCVCINTIMCMPEYRNRFPLLQYQDNLVAKVAYWPCLMSVVFAITFAVFY